MKCSILKRILSAIFLCIFLITTTITTFAADLTRYFCDGQWHEYNVPTTYLQVNGERIEADMPPIILNDRSVVPARAVFEKLGAEITWDGEKSQVGVSMDGNNIQLTINDELALVNGQQYEMDIPAKIINDRTMIPARFVGEALGMEVDWKGDERLITIDYVKEENNQSDDVQINELEYTKIQDGLRIAIKADKAIEEYSSFELDDHPRLVVDVKNALLEMEDNKIDINHNEVLGIRAAQFEVEPNITRFVIDMKEWTGYHIELSDSKTQMYIDFSNESSDKSSKVTGVDFLEDEDINIVEIKMDFIKKPNISRLSSPDRLVIDIPCSELTISEKLDTVNADIVKAIRYGQLDKSTTRILLDVAGQPQFELKETADGIRLNLKKPSYSNVYYTNKEEPKLIFYNNLSNCEYKEKNDPKANKYTISVPTANLDIGAGTLYINDSYFKFIDVVKNEQTDTTDIIFYSKKPYSYDIKPQTGENKTVVEVRELDPNDLEEEDDSEDSPDSLDIYIDPKIKNKIVVVDAGHGGTETGAFYDGIKEKDLNLDISLRLYKMLKNAGFKVYMIRTDDTTVGWKERAEYANNLGASLFVSIHNNSVPYPEKDFDVNGTETLYNPCTYPETYGISGRRFAEIVQTELVGRLGTADRRIKERPGLVVLNKTKMPAILAEIAFMTNPSNMQQLKTETFRQKAAEALYVGIIKALTETIQ